MPTVLPDITTRAKVREFMSEWSVTLMTDDLVTPDNEVDRAIEEAESTIFQYLLKKYPPTEIAASPWAVIRATKLAAFYLYERRGGPPPEVLYQAWERIVAELKELANNDNTVLPGAIPSELNSAPTVTNYVVDDRHIYNRLRVIPQQSTNTYPNQPVVQTNIQD